MGKSLLIVLIIAIFSPSFMIAQDIVNINIDEETFKQLELNIAAQVAANSIHNIQVDSIKKKQNKLLNLVTVIAGEKELLIQTYKNVSGFKQESKYYLAMVTTGTNIINHSSQALEAINKSKWTGKVRMTLNVSDLVTQAISFGKAFADIVANSEVPNPIKHPDATAGSKDKYNLLNRYERLRMANDILIRLQEIDHKICYLTYICKTSELRDLLFQIDRETYLNYIMTRVNINDMISKWNRVGL